MWNSRDSRRVTTGHKFCRGQNLAGGDGSASFCERPQVASRVDPLSSPISSLSTARFPVSGASTTRPTVTPSAHSRIGWRVARPSGGPDAGAGNGHEAKARARAECIDRNRGSVRTRGIAEWTGNRSSRKPRRSDRPGETRVPEAEGASQMRTDKGSQHARAFPAAVPRGNQRRKRSGTVGVGGNTGPHSRFGAPARDG
jgi:hypothetical protein